MRRLLGARADCASLHRRRRRVEKTAAVFAAPMDLLAAPLGDPASHGVDASKVVIASAGLREAANGSQTT